jgi:chloramphenicol 3-O-phosphotransferase
MATVTALVLLFAFTAGSVIWLARDANRSVSNRAAAQSIAFQSARSAAQQVAVASLRQGADIRVDESAARRAALSTAADLFAGYDVDGRVVDVTVLAPDTVRVEVRISDRAGEVTGIAAASTEDGR